MKLLDDEGYPTEEFIEFIANWKHGETPLRKLIDMIQEAWQFGDWGFILSKRPYRGKIKLELHTGGWSGNEEIIYAMQKNVGLMHLYMGYYMWRTGGHYYFRIPKEFMNESR